MNLRRMIIGEPLATSAAIHQRLSKTKALAVFSSDALSSTAYATEAILLVLIAGTMSALSISLWISIGIALLLVVVAFSYYQTIHAYPSGGGAYIVTKENLGTVPGLTAAAALLIDYVLTVAVSVSAGVAALISAFPAVTDFRVEIALIIVAFITVMNLRGIRESGTIFSIPTYAFIIGVLAMIAVGVFKVLFGSAVPLPPPDPEVLEETMRHSQELISGGFIFLILRAFAAGCTALTGVEAISDGIPAFKPPESDNAGKTLIVMVVLLCTMFIGTTFLANQFGAVALDQPPTVLSQVARAVFGEGSLLFYYMQIATLLILSLAANTAYADFPRLASLIAKDRYLPRQLTGLGDRLVFSNGIIALAVLSSLLIIVFNAREHNLLPLYAVGVFLGFTLSQSGMVLRWLRQRHTPDFVPTGSWRFKVATNAFGAVCTFIVLLILMVTKFTEGAWIVVLAIPIVMFLFTRIHKHYEDVAESLTLEGLHPGCIRVDTTRALNHLPVVVLLNSLNRSSLQALEYAVRLSDNVRVCAIEIEPGGVERLKAKWNEWDIEVPLDIVPSPYREVGRPLVDYLHQRDKLDINGEPTTVVLPEFVVEHWWERFMHNQTSVAIRDALYHDQIARGRGRPVINVPYRIGEELYMPLLVEELPVEETPEPETVGVVATNVSTDNTHQPKP
jgi:amino acid transporter